MPDLDKDTIRDVVKPFRVEPGTRVRLPRDYDPAATPGLRSEDSEGLLVQGIDLLSGLQERLAAQDTQSLLVIIQAIDAAGKDGTIRHVMSGVNPQGVRVNSFKVPSAEEMDHDFLWRYAKALPARGMIGIFNRSYYEELLVVRVHPGILEGQKLPPEKKDKGIWTRRFRHINDWEAYLADQGVTIVKLFLNMSREEQRQRFLARIDTPEKNWKFNAGDVKERAHWDEYQAAYSDVLSRSSTAVAPWYVIPADNKWYARIVAAGVIADAIIGMNPQFPKADEAERAALLASRAELVAEDPAAAAEAGVAVTEAGVAVTPTAGDAPGASDGGASDAGKAGAGGRKRKDRKGGKGGRKGH